MQFTAKQIAGLINGEIVGDPDRTVSQLSKIEEAGPGSLSFIANPKYELYLHATNASVLIVNKTLNITGKITPTLIRVDDAYGSLAILLEKYSEFIIHKRAYGRESGAYVADSAVVDKEVYIGANAYIDGESSVARDVFIYPNCYIGRNVKIGTGCVIYPGVKIYDNAVIGNHVVIHAGAVIGGDGFGFAPQQSGDYKKVPQIGNVIIEDFVEIGANTTIDKATFGSTIIRKGVKLDNLIQIAHNVEIGEHTVIAAQTGISGSTKIGKNCMIGGQVGIVGHITIADGTKINAQSGLAKSIDQQNLALTGSPAFDYKSALKSQAIFRNLPELQQRIAQLEELVRQLTKTFQE